MKVAFHEAFYPVYAGDPAAAAGRSSSRIRVRPTTDHRSLQAEGNYSVSKSLNSRFNTLPAAETGIVSLKITSRSFL